MTYADCNSLFPLSMQRISQYSNPSKVSRPSHHNHRAPEIHKIHLHGPLPGTLRLEDNKEIMGEVYDKFNHCFVRSLWEDTELRGKSPTPSNNYAEVQRCDFKSSHPISEPTSIPSPSFNTIIPPKKNITCPLKKGTILKGNESSSNHQFSGNMLGFRG